MTALLERPATGAVLLGQFPSGSPEWHAARQTRIGGSEVAAILGLSPWQSPFSLWHAKRNGWTTDSNAAMEWGSRVEPALLDWYFDHVGTQRGTGGTYVHAGRSWQLANPDALDLRTGGHVVVEAKTARYGYDWGTAGTDQIPTYYRTQVVWYMDTLGADQADIVVSIGGAPPLVYTVMYDAEEARLIRGQVAAFVRSLRHDVEPDLDDHVASFDTVRRLNPDIAKGEEVELPTGVFLGYVTAKRNLAAAEAASTEETARLLDAMGAAQYATWHGTRVARRQAKNGCLPFPVLTIKESS